MSRPARALRAGQKNDDPYLKRFGFLVAAQGFDAGTPFIFGISSKERTLRVCAIQGGGEE